MNTVLWILQAGLAVKFMVTAVGHGLIRTKEMREGISRMGFAQAQPVLAVTSILLVLGSLGLVAPAVLGVPWLVPASAGLLAVLMMASTTMHPGCRDRQQLWVSAIIFILCLFVGAGRLSNP